MNKNDLINKIIEQTGSSRTEVTRIVNQTFEIIKESVMEEERVHLSGFGSFQPVKRKARAGRNPQTGETIQIKEKNTVKFKIGKEFDEKIN
jgi:DNA-binding protein HU-beta